MGHVSPQFHVVFDVLFSNFSYMDKRKVPPNWAHLVENSKEKVMEEDCNLAKINKLLIKLPLILLFSNYDRRQSF
jgi:hypothetical protein